MQNQTNQPRRRVRIFSEIFDRKAASVYAAFDKADILSDELCICEDPHNCSCRAITTPTPRPWSMDRKMFHDPRPFLVYTIQRGDNESTRSIFVCKEEHEVRKEIKRLNSKLRHDMLWEYHEEKGFNSRTKADHALYMQSFGD